MALSISRGMRLGLGSGPTILGIAAPPGQVLAESADFWFDRRDATSGGQSLPNRGNTAPSSVLLNGSTSGVDSNDATFGTGTITADGTEGLRLPTEDTPTFTSTTGRFSMLFVGTVADSSFRRLWSAESDTNVGAFLAAGGTNNTLNGYANGSSGGRTVTRRDGRIAVGLVVDNGFMAVFDNVAGLDGAVAISALGAAGQPALFSRGGASMGLYATGTLDAYFSFHGTALTETEFADLAAWALSETAP